MERTLRVVSFNIGLRGIINTASFFGSMEAMFKALGFPDIVCLQEVKVAKVDLTEEVVFVKGYRSFFHFAHKGMYSGTATFVREDAGLEIVKVTDVLGLDVPKRWEEEYRERSGAEVRGDARAFGLGDQGLVLKGSVVGDGGELVKELSGEELEREGRTVAIWVRVLGGNRVLEPFGVDAMEKGSEAEVVSRELVTRNSEGGVVERKAVDLGERLVCVLNTYFPSGGGGRLDRVAFKIQFHLAIEDWVRKEKLRSGCLMMVCGDLNVVRGWRDHCDAKGWCEYVGVEATEEKFGDTPLRRWLRRMAAEKEEDEEGIMVDTFRWLWKEETSYTCWNEMTSARKTNYGTRIDAILADREKLADALIEAKNLGGIAGSDHCPVLATFSFLVGEEKERKSGASFLGVPPQKTESLSSSFLEIPPQKTEESFLEIPPQKTEASKFLDHPCNPETWSKFSRRQSKIRSFFSKSIGPMSLTPEQEEELRKLEQSPTKKVQASLSSFFAKPKSAGSKRPREPVTQSHPTSPPPKPKKPTSATWKGLLTGLGRPPLCRCNCPAVERIVKDGPNKGKLFFVCSKPEGKRGVPGARCNFFRWGSDHLKSQKK